VNNGSQTLPANVVSNFFVLAGDANHDATVNLLDFNILAGNFGLSGKIFSQGDFNYDGTVNLLDFNILSGNFGTSVGPESSALGSRSPFASVANRETSSSFSAPGVFSATRIQASYSILTCSWMIEMACLRLRERGETSRNAAIGIVWENLGPLESRGSPG
jgi:hypothetical protein